MRKTFKTLICGVIVCLALGACSGETVKSDISGYLDSFKRMDYEAMFSYTSPTVEIDKKTFVQKYNAVFSGLGVTEIAIEKLSGPDASGVFTYDATYKTKDYGDFTNSFQLKTRTGKDGCKVLWNYSLIFPDMEAGGHVRVQTEEASRGEIFAADGSLLAGNSYADTVYMQTSKVQDISAVAAAACPVTGLSQTEIVEKFNKALANKTDIVTLRAFFADELTDAQKQSILSVPGLGIDDKSYTPIRDYPMGEAASHIIGYTGYADKKNLPEGYTTSDRLGLAGLEASYETQLRGKDGKIVYIENPWGENIRTLYEEPAEQGKDLRLTIDSSLQQKAYTALKELLTGDETGVAIIMDAATGGVQAMTSYPSYDNNQFTFGLSDEYWDYLNDSKNNRPLFFRATQGQYPPGSVIKPFAATAALESGTITPDTVFEGQIVDNKWMPEEEGWTWPAITRADDSGTPLKLENAIVKSDNIYFAFAALKMGEQTYPDYLERIGFKTSVPFDLPVKSANLINSTTKMDRGWLAVMGYGQGELLITPIQLAAMYTAFASGTGDMRKPMLVQKLCRTEGLKYVTVQENKPEVWIDNAVSKKSLNILEPILEKVMMQGGTGSPARIKGVKVAAKTGTAEIGNDKSREISWFAGYWVDGSYDRLVVVMVDVAANEGSVKFDIAKRLLMP